VPCTGWANPLPTVVVVNVRIIRCTVFYIITIVVTLSICYVSMLHYRRFEKIKPYDVTVLNVYFTSHL
jgi:hypothetical protein